VASYALPLVYALFVWWFSTGVILFLSGLARRTHGWSLAGATALAIWALVALHQTRDDTTVLGVYVAFTAGILLWAWHEVTFLLGAVTGPRTEPCPERCSGWARFVYATQAILYHEFAIVLTLIAAAVAIGDGANQVGLWTFGVLWVMRLSAKLNLFFGVPKLHTELLPDHLVFIGSYFRKRTMNALFPLSVTAGTIVTLLIVLGAIGSEPDSAGRAGGMLVAALLGLAVLEHWFMVLPWQDTALWQWALKARAAVQQRRSVPGLDSKREGGPPVLGVRAGSL
jgi:putative photosynthetic complex assembly protein 2